MATLDYTPSVENVATHLRARTRGPDGTELGTFTDATVPTDQQVTEMIDAARPFVTGALGAVPVACEDGARTLWAIKAAELVEVSYFPESLQGGSTVAALRALWMDLLPLVRACVSGDGVGGGGNDGDATTPASCFYDYDADGRLLYDGGRWIDGRDMPAEIVIKQIVP